MKSKQTTSDVLIETLIDWGIDIIFGLPGDGINGIVEALRTRQDRIRFIVARHEEAAAFMACAYAKWTGKMGCCLATTGPGGVHLLNGLYDAKFDRAPVLAITGLPYHDLLQTSTQQDIDHSRLFQDVAEHSTTIVGAAQVAQATTLACRTDAFLNGSAPDHTIPTAPRFARRTGAGLGAAWRGSIAGPSASACHVGRGATMRRRGRPARKRQSVPAAPHPHPAAMAS